MTTYATTLRRYRLRARLSQNALAHRLGLDASYLNRMEAGVRGTPGYDVALSLARELARSAEELDLLLFAAGYVPPRLQRLGPGDTTVAAVLDILANDRLTLESRADFRAVVETVAGRWARDACAGSAAPRWVRDGPATTPARRRSHGR